MLRIHHLVLHIPRVGMMPMAALQYFAVKETKTSFGYTIKCAVQIIPVQHIVTSMQKKIIRFVNLNI
jgi:hypothetical protein